MNLIQIEQNSMGISQAVEELRSLIETEAAGRYVHYALEGFPQWDTLCALEDVLIDTVRYEDWSFVVGTVANDAETKGWLEYKDWIVLPYSPARKGSNIGIWSRVDWDELDYLVMGVAPAGPDSGILLNAISKSLGHGVLGDSPKNKT